MSVLGKRLKEARLRAGLSQEQLGIEADLDPMSASTRMNRYELGKRMPNFALVEKFADVLGVPAPYFYAADDALAEMIVNFGKMPPKERAKLS
jgi:transcriptional regulator with XRE-family HTH domain